MNENIIVNDRYIIDKKIGKGSFGEVYLGYDKHVGHLVGIKLEHQSTKHMLKHEYDIYLDIQQCKYKPLIPDIFWFGSHREYQVMVMQYLGNSLDFFMQRCRGKFTIKTTLMLGIQLLDLISGLHSCGYIHRDIKPDNFLMGLGVNSKKVHLIDLGLAKQFKKKAHIKPLSGKQLIGTARYASINSHIGNELSRRDDLESLGYMLIYFIKGELPWQGLTAKSKNEKYSLIGQAKKNLSIEVLTTGVPKVFHDYMTNVRSLEFKQRPDYRYLRNLFTTCFQKNKFLYDFFDWEVNYGYA